MSLPNINYSNSLKRLTKPEVEIQRQLISLIPEIEKACLQKIEWLRNQFAGPEKPEVCLYTVEDFRAMQIPFLTTLSQLEEKDLQPNASLNAKGKKRRKKWISLFKIPKKKRSTLLFWSGTEAREYAYKQHNKKLCDAQLPAFAFALSLLRVLKSKEEQQLLPPCLSPLLEILNKGSSLAYASQAERKAVVYFSSNKPSEPSGLTSGNFFWNYELPTLQSNGVKIVIYLKKEHDWEGPINFKSNGNKIMVLRRSLHPQFEQVNDPRFLFDKGGECNESWKLAPPRPMISVGRLRTLLKMWKHKAKQIHSDRVTALKTQPNIQQPTFR